MAGPRLRGQPIMLKSALSGGDLIQLLISQIRSAVQLQEALPVSIRRLRVDDIDQVVTIEKEAFSPLWVSSSFKRELNNKRANYLVACFDEDVSPEEILAEIDSDRPAQDEEPRPTKLWSRLLGRLGLLLPCLQESQWCAKRWLHCDK